MKRFKVHEQGQLWWLLGWMGVGLILRFANLTGKPLWTDEFATIAFSLGRGFRAVPLDRVISAAELLQPLAPNAQAGLADVTQRLLTESNHPPLFFWLMHLWLQLFPGGDGDSFVGWVRSLPALFGVLTIPASFWLGRLAFGSGLAAHFSAAFMAISPFAIYLSQEARHYTLPMLWLIASLGCLMTAIRWWRVGKTIPWWLCLLWIVVNALGIATHYFVVLALMAEAIALLYCCLRAFPAPDSALLRTSGVRLTVVAAAALVSFLPWLPFLQGVQDSELTRWIYRGGRSGLALLEPLAQLLAGWVTLFYLLPIQGVPRVVVIGAAIALVGLMLWTVPQLLKGLRLQVQSPQGALAIRALGGFVVVAIALFLGITYLRGMDLTSAFRYQFVYFPAVVVLLGGSLAALWQGAEQASSRKAVLWMGGFCLLGALTVVANLGYQKTHAPDQMVQAIQQQGEAPALVAIAHRTHGQTGRLMGIAWEWRRAPATQPEPQYLLAHQGTDPAAPVAVLGRSLSQLPRPLDVWLVNFRTVPAAPLAQKLSEQGCNRVSSDSVDGYRSVLYQCR
jgi:uncharacterized membrane protein